METIKYKINSIYIDGYGWVHSNKNGNGDINEFFDGLYYRINKPDGTIHEYNGRYVKMVIRSRSK